jgi:hypothetical protein
MSIAWLREEGRRERGSKERERRKERKLEHA